MHIFHEKIQSVCFRQVFLHSEADAIKKFTPSLGIPYLGV
jgi:hypothetical protein